MCCLLGDEQDAVDLVDLDELHLDALAARRWAGSCRRSRGGSAARGGRGRRRRRAGRGRAGRSRRAPRSRRGSSAPCRGRRRRGCRCGPRAGSRAGLADERLRVQRRLAAADVDVVAVEGDVERPEVDLDAAELLDQPAEAVRERDAARVDADERDRVEVGVRLDDLVGDPVKGALERFCVEELPAQRGLGQRVNPISFPASLDRVKGRCSKRDRLALPGTSYEMCAGSP